MGRFYTFHKTVRGHLHILKATSCEDCSGSYTQEQGAFYIAAVADGHGDPSCMRSARGSRLAVESVMECLKEYAGKKDKPEAASLAEQIVSRWRERVEADIAHMPLSEEELGKAGMFEEAYRSGRRLKHVYGTTVIAALMLPDSLVLIQQGDGRCEVFYEDGTVDQPIPWDEKCYQNVTTSLCEEDAAKRIRHRVLDLTEKRVIACYLGSDGVEDSYRNMEGTHTFYRDLSCRLCGMKAGDIGEYLDEMLSHFSREGSGDDVSVAGIVDLECVRKHIPSFQRQVKRYGLEEEAAKYEGRRISMSRKHGILKKRWEEAGKLLEDSQRRLKSEQDENDRLRSEINNADRRVEEARRQWRECSAQSENIKAVKELTANGRFWGDWPWIRSKKWFNVGSGPRKVRQQKEEWKDRIQWWEFRKKQLLEELSAGEERKRTLSAGMEDVRTRYQTARDNFEEYDRTYQEIQAALDHVYEEIAGLGNQSKELSSDSFENGERSHRRIDEMAFNPNNYKAPAAKRFPVILLLDVSGSMSGEKIDTLYESVLEMIDSFVAAAVKETIIDVAVITFGSCVELHTPYTSVGNLKEAGIKRFHAAGMTPMGMAFKMAKDMIDDKETTPSNVYRPAVVLVSDGQPNDRWEQPLEAFIREGRSSKCQRFAIAVGDDADRKILERFTGDQDSVFFAEDAAAIADCFQKFTMSVSTRALSKNPNVVEKAGGVPADPGTQDTEEEDDEYI